MNDVESKNSLVVRLLKSSSVYAISGILRNLIGFIMLPVYTRYLSPADYGIVALMVFVVSLIEITVAGRMGHAPQKFYHDEQDEKNCLTPEQNGNCSFGDCIYNENVLRTLNDEKFTGNAFKAKYAHNDSDWYYRILYQRQNAGFRGDLGFISRVDQNKISLSADRRWYAEQGSWWSKFTLSPKWHKIHNDNNELIEERFNVSANVNAKYSSHLRLGLTHRDKVGSRINNSILAIKNNTTLFTENRLYLSASIKPILGLNLILSI